MLSLINYSSYELNALFEIIEEAFQVQKLVVGTAFNDLPFLEHVYHVWVTDGLQSMSDTQSSLAFSYWVQGLLDFFLVVIV